ncbi:unnamed protein product, partial [marine sediment metagenome]
VCTLVALLATMGFAVAPIALITMSTCMTKFDPSIGSGSLGKAST